MSEKANMAGDGEPVGGYGQKSIGTIVTMTMTHILQVREGGGWGGGRAQPHRTENQVIPSLHQLNSKVREWEGQGA